MNPAPTYPHTQVTERDPQGSAKLLESVHAYVRPMEVDIPWVAKQMQGRDVKPDGTVSNAPSFEGFWANLTRRDREGLYRSAWEWAVDAWPR